MLPVCFWLNVLAALGPSEDGRFAPVDSRFLLPVVAVMHRPCARPALPRRAFAISHEKWREMVSRLPA